jgi:hypothetical protein
MINKIIMMLSNNIKNILVYNYSNNYNHYLKISVVKLEWTYTFNNTALQSLKPWKVLKQSNQYGILAEAAIKLCCSVPGIGGLERTFNAVRRI